MPSDIIAPNTEATEVMKEPRGLDRRALVKTAAASAALAAPATLSARPVAAAPDGSSGLRKGERRNQSMASGGLSKARLELMQQAMAAHVESGYVPGLVTLVSRGDDVAVDAIGTLAFDSEQPMQRDTIFRIASVTKPITAAAAMILVEECKLRLDDPVDELLPELAGRQVLRSIDAPLDDTVPANRPITLRDLLTFRLGHGAVMVFPNTYPIQDAMDEAGVSPGPESQPLPPDEFMRRLGTLPLLHQPGEEWHYNTGSDVLGVLIARATGQGLGDFLQERIFDPLGMKDTGFSVPADKLDRLPTVYMRNFETGDLDVFDGGSEASAFARPAVFESGAGGLASTVDDLLAFGQMMLHNGTYEGERILSRPSIELMTTDQITPEQKARSPFFPGFWDNRGWGFGVAIVTRRDNLAATPGRYGWDGGWGTSWYLDPTNGLIGIMMTQRTFDALAEPPTYADFWTSAYQAIED